MPLTLLSRRHRFALSVAGLTLALGVSAAAQLATRPAEEWRKVLDSPDRLAAMRVDEVVARLGLKPADVVADLGAGTGPFDAVFAKAVPQGMVYAVEVDSGFFPLIEAKAQAAGVTNVRTVLGAFADPKLPVTNVDVAFMHDVLHHVSERGPYFKALAKYLKPTARIAIVDYEPSHSPHRDQPELQVSKDQAKALLAEAGFKPIEDVALFSDKWFLVFGR